MADGPRALPRTTGRRSGDRTTMLRMLMHACRCTHRASLASAAPSMPPITCVSTLQDQDPG